MSPMRNDTKPRCQSCGMVLGGKNRGSERDGIPSPRYCSACYRDGEFTEPDLTFEGMIEKTVHYMTTYLDMSEEEADQRASSIIPSLERWQE